MGFHVSAVFLCFLIPIPCSPCLMGATLRHLEICGKVTPQVWSVPWVILPPKGFLIPIFYYSQVKVWPNILSLHTMGHSYQPLISVSLFSAAWLYSLGFYFRKPHFECQFLYYSGQDRLCYRNKITPKSQWPEQTEVYMSLMQSPAWAGSLSKAAPSHVVNLGSQILPSYHLNIWPLWLLMIVTGRLHKMFLMAKHERSDLHYFHLLPVR